jgi:hypothetical protein
MELVMAKGQRSNREHKKPKQVKAKPAAMPAFSKSITAQLTEKK